MVSDATDEPLDIHVVYSIPSPYQEQLFELVADHDDITLSVHYCGEINEDRNWVVDIGDYDYEILDAVSVKMKRINPSIVRTLRRERPDAVVVGGYAQPTMQLAILTARALDIPVVLWSESHSRDWQNKNPDARTRVKDVLLRALTRACDAYLVPGRLQKEYLLAHGASPDRIFTGSHACDVTAFRSAARETNVDAIRDQYGITEETVLTFVGRLIEEKGVLDLVDAVERLSADNDVAAVIAGDGPLADRLATACRQRGLDNVYLLGFVPRRELPELYSASDLFVFPSRGDPWGVVVNEAMAAGLPVVTTSSVGAGHDLVLDGVNGALVPPGDSVALARTVEGILRRDEVGTMGEQAIRTVENWTHRTARDAFVAAVRTAARGHDC